MLKKLRRYICILLTAALATMFTPAAGITAGAELSGTGWSFDETTGALTVTTNDGTTAWRSSCDKKLVQSVEIQEGVTSIGNSAFSGCTVLVSIEIPDSVKSIGSQAFSSCYKLESIKIPDGVKSIGLMTFWDCLDLASIEIPDSVTSIGNFAFVGCRSLESIKIPNGVESINWSAFMDCKGLTSIDIPDSVTSIGGCAFQGCSGLTSIVIPNNVTSIGSSAFEGCSGLTSIIIPDNVASIGEEALKDCSSLTSIVIPDSVTSIDNNVFEGCSSLDNIIYPSGLDVSGTSVSDTATQVKYTVENGEVTITEIILPDGKDPIEIPDTIGGKNVKGVSEAVRDKVSQNGHTHKGGTATCQKGAVCVICGQEYGDLAAHSLTHIELKEATCTEDGNIEYWTCSVCDKIFGDENGTTEITDTAIPAAGHTMTHTERKEPTCTEAGNIEYWTCSKCHKIFGDSEGRTGVADTGIAALGHNYADGKCTRCQEIQSDHEHIGGTATCTQKAVCEICHKEYGALASHTPDGGTVTKQPTETETGVRTFQCTVCGNVIKTETIPALGGGPVIPSRPTNPTKPVTPSDSTIADQPDEPETPSRPDNEVPFIKDENGKSGWDVIKGEIGKAEGGSAVTVDMNGAAVVPGNIFNTLKGKDVTVVFDLGDGITWSVNGRNITSGKTPDIDFSVKSYTESIPVDVVNNITGERYGIQISLAHNGEFGFTAVLSINLGRDNAGQKATLYYYNGGALELMCESEISADGTARLTFAHASDYLIVIGETETEEDGDSDAAPSDDSDAAPSGDSDTAPSGDSDTASSGDGNALSGGEDSASSGGDTGERDSNPSTGAAVSLMPFAAAAAIAAAAKRRRK